MTDCLSALEVCACDLTFPVDVDLLIDERDDLFGGNFVAPGDVLNGLLGRCGCSEASFDIAQDIIRIGTVLQLCANAFGTF